MINIDERLDAIYTYLKLNNVRIVVFYKEIKTFVVWEKIFCQIQHNENRLSFYCVKQGNSSEMLYDSYAETYLGKLGILYKIENLVYKGEI